MKFDKIRFKIFLKKFAIYTLVAFFIGLLVTSINIFKPNFSQSFDNKIKDYMFLARGAKKENGSVVIIDIDEKSLNELGQWPWSRHKVAKILENLTLAGVGVIGFDIVFAEKDKSSPHMVLQEIGMDSSNVQDYDQILNEMVAKTPTVLGYQFELEDKAFIKKDELDIPAIIIEKNKIAGEDMLINAKGTILNHKSLQESAYTSGFFNNIPDDSGIVRSVPMVIRYDDQLYPSLALEIIRASSGINKVYVNYSNLGVENIQIGDFKIPTDRHGRLEVNYRGASHTFKYISALDIYNGSFDASQIEGKVALIGTSAAGINDLRAIPFESVYPGVEVHANAIDNILTGDFLYRANWVEGANLIGIFLVAFLSMIIVAFTPFWFNPIVLFSIIGIILYSNFKILFDFGIILNTFLPLVTVLISVLAATFMDYMFEVKNEARIKKKFASKVSKEVMDSLLHDPDNKAFAAMQKEITVFFSDVRNFTNISESMPNANILIEFLNEYMNPMTKIIIEQKGTVDKFIGDAIMAYWNAPGNVPDHAERAVIATLEQLHIIDDLNKKIKQDPRFENTVKMSEKMGTEPIDIGIGLNTGIAVAGEMGSDQRSDYTVIGDPVNLGARLESLCKYYNSKCNISNFTKEQLKGKYIFRFLDLVTVKGKSEPIEIWQIHDYDRDESIHKLYKVSKDRIKQELSFYHKAIDLYKSSSFDEALKIFNEINEWKDKTNKNIYDIYIKRCEHYIKEPPKDFNGVFKHTTKG